MPGDQGGPQVVSVVNDHTFVKPGTIEERMQGALEPSATGVAIGLPGDRGYWVHTAQVPDVVSPDLPSFEVLASYASNFPLGPFQLAVEAVSPDGRFGPPYLVALEARPNPPPDGELVFSLTWSHNVDLDLHVVLPDGTEVWRGNPNSVAPPPPGAPVPDPSVFLRGGIFQGDSNGNCVLDGRRTENVVWTMPAPSGRYIVRVDTFSLCSLSFSYWSVDVLQRGVRIATAQGVSRLPDTRPSHTAGGGITALETDVP
jgi:hypothetical protein